MLKKFKRKGDVERPDSDKKEDARPKYDKKEADIWNK